ncbi:MAG TPA: hypothetical protein VMF06_17075 [Candidatus Limnocylindria bacterium]|jgi:hypothetical protein|nr:hypothetical protein [Candidatus Limnocylindria bacterium]
MSVPSRALVVSCLIGTFVAGAVSGGFVGANVASRTIAKPPSFKPEDVTKRMCERFTGELGLTPPQKEAFEKIIHEHSLKMEAAHKRMGSEIKGLFQQMDDQLLAQLDAEQKIKFIEFNKKRAHRNARPEGEKPQRFDPPPPGAPPTEPPK